MNQSKNGLDQNEGSYQSLFKNMMQGFALHKIVTDEKGNPVDYTFIEINDSFEKLTSLSRENLIGNNVTDVIPGIEKDPVNWIGKYGKVALTQESIEFENYSTFLKKWYSIKAYSPEKNYFVTIFEDITDKMETKEKLKESENDYRELFEQTPGPVEVYAKDGLQIKVNKAYEDLWQFPRETTVNKFNILESEEVEKSGLMKYVKQAYSGEVAHVPPYKFDPSGKTESDGQGRVRWLSTLIYPLNDSNGELRNIVVVHEDVTEKREAEKRSREKVEELERFQELTINRELKMVELKNKISSE